MLLFFCFESLTVVRTDFLFLSGLTVYSIFHYSIRSLCRYVKIREDKSVPRKPIWLYKCIFIIKYANHIFYISTFIYEIPTSLFICFHKIIHFFYFLICEYADRKYRISPITTRYDIVPEIDVIGFKATDISFWDFPTRSVERVSYKLMFSYTSINIRGNSKSAYQITIWRESEHIEHSSTTSPPEIVILILILPDILIFYSGFLHTSVFFYRCWFDCDLTLFESSCPPLKPCYSTTIWRESDGYQSLRRLKSYICQSTKVLHYWLPRCERDMTSICWSIDTTSCGKREWILWPIDTRGKRLISVIEGTKELSGTSIFERNNSKSLV